MQLKKGQLIHIQLSAVIAAMAHDDYIIIGDAGLPVPKDVTCVDLALSPGIPGFIDTLNAVLSELYVQEAYIDKEQAEISPHMNQQVLDIVGDQFPLHVIPHMELQGKLKGAKAVIRTGEFTPYANIVLVGGVLF